MVDITKKYENVIKEIKEVAAANVAEAQENVRERSDELQECKAEVKKLKTTKNETHKAFFDVIKTLSKLAFAKDPSAEEVRKAIEPCDTYAMAKGQLPVAEENMEEAAAELEQAEAELEHSEFTLECISFLS